MERRESTLSTRKQIGASRENGHWCGGGEGATPSQKTSGAKTVETGKPDKKSRLDEHEQNARDATASEQRRTAPGV